MEGLRVAPAYLDARADKRVPASCEECKQATTVIDRKHMACGYEAPLLVGKAQPWSPDYMESTVCPGYTTSLPAVTECFGAYPQWEHGSLRDYLGGPAPAEALDCLAALRAGMKEHEAAEIRRKSKGSA